MLRLGFIGAGIVGTALAIRLSENHYPAVAVSSRNTASAAKLAQSVKGCRVYSDNQSAADNADLVFVTTQDYELASAVSGVSWHKGQSVVHCSGANSLDILEPAQKAGAMAGSFHPFQAFASVEQAVENLPGTTFGIEAEQPLFGILEKMATALSGDWVKLTARDKVAYHVTAIMASNYLVTLVKLSTDLWQSFGVPPEKATGAFIPLLKGTVNNIQNLGIPECLTGPISRGEMGTLQKHLDTLDKTAPQIASTYRELGLQTVPVALAKGKINAKQALEMLKLLSN